MSTLNPYGHIKPTSNRFEEYLDDLRARWKSEEIRPQRIHAAVAFLRELERLRMCFSAMNHKAFTTKNISNKVLAERMGYQTVRQIQKLRQWLEGQGILNVMRPKLTKFLNGWNRYEFADFKAWFSTRFQQTSCKTGHPVKDNDQRSLLTKKSRICFPAQDLTSWDRSSQFWKVIAEEALRGGERLPCLKSASADFRTNLHKHEIPFDHASIIARWKAFIRKRMDFKAMRNLAP